MSAILRVSYSCITIPSYPILFSTPPPPPTSNKQGIQFYINPTSKSLILNPRITTFSPTSSKTDSPRSPPSQHDSPICPIAARARHQRPLRVSVVAVVVAAAGAAAVVAVAVVRRDGHWDQTRWCWG